jgi:hypothetical protein
MRYIRAAIVTVTCLSLMRASVFVSRFGRAGFEASVFLDKCALRVWLRYRGRKE